MFLLVCCSVLTFSWVHETRGTHTLMISWVVGPASAGGRLVVGLRIRGRFSSWSGWHGSAERTSFGYRTRLSWRGDENKLRSLEVNWIAPCRLAWIEDHGMIRFFRPHMTTRLIRQNQILDLVPPMLPWGDDAWEWATAGLVEPEDVVDLWDWV